MDRAPVLLALGLSALAACGGEGPDDPALSTPGAGIPMGAVGAVGVALEGPTTRPDPSLAKGKIPSRGGGHAPAPAPVPSLDPFADPDPPVEAPAPKGHAPSKSHPSTETTL